MPDIEGTGFTRRIGRLTGPRAVAATPGISRKAFAPTFEMEFKPGLRLCLSDEHDLDVWVNEMVASRLYSEESARDNASRWIKNPLKWAIKTMWKNKIIQLEAFHFFTRLKPVLWGGLAVHVDRVRPHWFWKVISRPVLSSIYNHGFRTIKTHVRSNAPVYAKFLQQAYGYQLIKETDRGFLMSMEIEDAITRIEDWPKRRTLGPDWKWEKDGILVREATEADFPAIYKAIEDSWGDNPRKELALSRTEDLWKLDCATIILGFKDGKILNARAYREREQLNVNLAVFPVKLWTRAGRPQSPDFRNIDVAFDIWQLGVGYKTGSAIIETKLYSPHAEIWHETGWHLHAQNDSITELRQDLEADLAKKTSK